MEVLDFVPLLREFYQKSGIDARLPAYLRMYQAEGDLLRRPTIEMVKSVLSYLHTQPVTTYSERVVVNAPGSNNSRVCSRKPIQMRLEIFSNKPNHGATPGHLRAIPP